MKIPLHKYYQLSPVHFNNKQKIIAGLIFISISTGLYLWIDAGRKFMIYLAFVFGNNTVEYKLSHWAYFDWFLAAISSILAFGFALKYLFGSPGKVFESHYRKRINIVVDQIFLPYNFMYWFIKVFFSYGLLMIFLTPDLLQFHTHYIYIFALAALVLFFQLWQHIFLYLRRSSYKYFLFSGFGIVIYSFLLSQISLFGQNRLDKMISQSKLVYKYHLRLPVSPVKEHRQDFSPVFRKKLYVFCVKNPIKGEIYDDINISMDGQEFLSYKQLEQKFYELKYDTVSFDPPFFGYTSRPETVVLEMYIDKRIKMPEVEEIFRTAYHYGFDKIAFIINNGRNELRYRLPSRQDSFQRQHRIIVAKYGYAYLDGKEIKPEDLKKVLLQYYRNPNNGELLILNEKDAFYEDFINLLSVQTQIKRINVKKDQRNPL